MKNSLNKRSENSIIDLDEEKALEVADEAKDKGIEIADFIEDGYAKGLKQVGEKFEKGELFLPELSRAGEIMENVMDILEPSIEEQGGELSKKAIVVIGTVKGDLHNIGKNLVKGLLIANGYEVYDLGMDTPKEEFLEKAREVNADVIGASCLLTSTKAELENIVEYLEKEGVRDDYLFVVGGAAVSDEFVSEIGADGFGEDGPKAVKLLDNLLDKNR